MIYNKFDKNITRENLLKRHSHSLQYLAGYGE